MEIHKPNILGDIQLSGSAGTAGQVIVSHGSGGQAQWATVSRLAPLYAATDKTAQLTLLGASDLTWNNPVADAIHGITFNGTTLWTLTANRTYLISAYIKPTVAAVGYVVTICGTDNIPVGSLNLPISALANLNIEVAQAWFRPLVDTQIKVRISGGLGVTVGSASRIIIQSQD